MLHITTSLLLIQYCYAYHSSNEKYHLENERWTNASQVVRVTVSWDLSQGVGLYYTEAQVHTAVSRMAAVVVRKIKHRPSTSARQGRYR